MTYKHLENETNQEREIRLAAEYADYLVETENPTNYMNWLASKKFHERQAEGTGVTAKQIAESSIGREDGQ